MLRFAGGKINIALPGFGGIEGSWEPDESERNAAWELYVELVTRISVQGLRDDEGLLVEALSSLYSLFETTRSILRKYGPTVGRPNNESDVSFGYVALAVLNHVLRPVLAKWHPLLQDYEDTKPAAVMRYAHECAWTRATELRAVLAATRSELIDFANVLASVAKVPPLELTQRT